MSLPENPCKVISTKASLTPHSAGPQSGHVRRPRERGRGRPGSSGPDRDTLHQELSLGADGGTLEWGVGRGWEGIRTGRGSRLPGVTLSSRKQRSLETRGPLETVPF